VDTCGSCCTNPQSSQCCHEVRQLPQLLLLAPLGTKRRQQQELWQLPDLMYTGVQPVQPVAFTTATRRYPSTKPHHPPRNWRRHFTTQRVGALLSLLLCRSTWYPACMLLSAYLTPTSLCCCQSVSQSVRVSPSPPGSPSLTGGHQPQGPQHCPVHTRGTHTHSKIHNTDGTHNRSGQVR